MLSMTDCIIANKRSCRTLGVQHGLGALGGCLNPGTCRMGAAIISRTRARGTTAATCFHCSSTCFCGTISATGETSFGLNLGHGGCHVKHFTALHGKFPGSIGMLPDVILDFPRAQNHYHDRLHNFMVLSVQRCYWSSIESLHPHSYTGILLWTAIGTQPTTGWYPFKPWVCQ